MNRYSIRLAWVGALIGVLTLSAAAVAKLSGAEARNIRQEPGNGEPAALTEAVEADPDPWGEAVQVFAPAEAAGSCVLHFASARPAPAYELRDLRGKSYGILAPDGNREAKLGPLEPGRYQILCGGTAVGSFRVTETAAVEEAAGRLWSDGTRLWLEDFSPGAAEVRVTLTDPGYYSFQLVDDLGRQWTRDVFISDRAPRDPDGCFNRTLRYDGLPESRYTLVEAGQPLAQFQVLAGGTAMIDAEKTNDS